MMHRIMLIGGPGAGKTWLGHALASQLGLPLFSVDDEVWDDARKLRPADEIDRRVRALAARPRWIIEGGNTRTYPERVARADLVIRLDPPLLLRALRVLRRRPSRALFGACLGYDRLFGDRDAAALAAAPPASRLCLRHKADIRRLLATLRHQAPG